MIRNQKFIAIFTVFLLLGVITYQASANVGYIDNPIVASLDEASEVAGSGDDYAPNDLDEATDYKGDEALVDAVHPEFGFEVDLDSGYLDDPLGDWGYFDFDDFEIVEPEGGFMGIAPMWGRTPTLAWEAYCYYTGDRITPQLGVPVTWTPDAGIEHPPFPQPFFVHANVADFEPPPEGWSLVASRIRYMYRYGPNLLFSPWESVVGDTMTFQFSFDFRQDAGDSWVLVPVIELAWRPAHPPIVKEVAPVAPATFPAQVGDQVEYTITITNPAANPIIDLPGGPWFFTTFDNFRVVDNLPPELALVPGTVEVSGGRNVVDSSANNVIDVTFDLPGSNEDGHTVVITFRATITEAALLVDEINNTAYLTHPYYPDDYDEEIVPVVNPDVSLVKSVYPIEVDPGESVTYTLVVTNTGDIPLTNVVVTDDLPVELTNPRNLTINPANAGAGSFVGQLLTVTIPRLEVDESVTITFDATVAGNTPGGTVIDNVAEVTTDQNVYDEDDATVTVNVPPVLRNPGVSLEKSVSSERVAPGGDLRYTLVVRNTGDVVLTNVLVTDNLPVQLTNPRNLVITPQGAGSGSFVGQLLTVLIPTLGINESVTIVFDVTVAENVNDGAVIRNVAIVTTEEGPSDEDDATTIVEDPPQEDPPPQRRPPRVPRAPLTGDSLALLLYILMAQLAVGTTLWVSFAKRRRAS